jgi:hypothetical protein
MGASADAAEEHRAASAVLPMLRREFHAKSLDESLAERRQCLGWGGAGFLDRGDAPAADGDDQRDDPPDGALLDGRLDGAIIKGEEYDETTIGCQPSACVRATAAAKELSSAHRQI